MMDLPISDFRNRPRFAVRAERIEPGAPPKAVQHEVCVGVNLEEQYAKAREHFAKTNERTWVQVDGGTQRRPLMMLQPRAEGARR
jgi:hypothetical protein